MASIGRVLLIPKGDYSSSVTYNNLDWVRYNGKAWVCKVDGTVNVTPVQGDTWQLLAQDGSGGGGGASDWDDINYKPFDTVDTTNDFEVDSLDNNKLKIKRDTFGTMRIKNGASTTDLEASGDSIFEIDAGTNVSIAADDSSNPKKITISASGGGGGSSTFAGLDDVSLSGSPSVGQIVQYTQVGGDVVLQNTNMPTIPTVDSVFDATSSTHAQSGSGIAGYVNTFTYRRTKTGTGATGVGTWDDSATPTETDWWSDSAFIIPNGVDEDSIEIKILFEPLADGTPIVLGGYIWDTTTGKICIKFANDITDYMATAKVAVDITYTRNEVV